MREALIKLEDVSVTYDKGKLSEMQALKKVSLEIYPEEYIIFFGPSGCGKSTLLYTMAGLETANTGKVLIRGNNLLEMNTEQALQYHRQELGMVFQAFYLIPSLSVIDNVMLPQMFIKRPMAERRQEAMAVLERFDIAKFADHLPTELSGGQQQRVALCRAVINNPSLVFADEPVGNLDSKSAEKVMELLLELNQKDKKTVVLVTHDPRYLRYAHRIFYIRDGQLTHEVSNPERTQLREEKSRPLMPHALVEFARYYPNLDEAELKVKFLGHYLLEVPAEEQQERLEKLIRLRAAGKISRLSFIDRANTAFKEGGVGLYVQTADRLADEIDMVFDKSKFIQARFDHDKFVSSFKELKSSIEMIKDYILRGYSGSLTKEQRDRLDQAVQSRLEGTMDHKQFRSILDTSVSKGGVGLHFQTAQELSRRIELVLIDYPDTPPPQPSEKPATSEDEKITLPTE